MTTCWGPQKRPLSGSCLQKPHSEWPPTAITSPREVSWREPQEVQASFPENNQCSEDAFVWEFYSAPCCPSLLSFLKAVAEKECHITARQWHRPPWEGGCRRPVGGAGQWPGPWAGRGRGTQQGLSWAEASCGYPSPLRFAYYYKPLWLV